MVSTTESELTLQDELTGKWVLACGSSVEGVYLYLNPELTLRELRRWISKTFGFRRDLKSMELLAVIERALTHPAGRYMVASKSYDFDENIPWIAKAKELADG
jgi:hypothetical protein